MRLELARMSGKECFLGHLSPGKSQKCPRVFELLARRERNAMSGTANVPGVNREFNEGCMSDADCGSGADHMSGMGYEYSAPVASAGFRSTYRREQEKLLRRKLLGRMFALLGVWAAAFCLFALAFNAVMVPRIAEVVADQFAPWRIVNAQNAGTEEWAAFQTAVQTTKVDTLVGYMTDLYGSSEGKGSPREGASKEALALADGVAKSRISVSVKRVDI